MIKLFTNGTQIRLLNSKSTDLDWYYFKHFWKLKLLIHDLLFTTFMKKNTANTENSVAYLGEHQTFNLMAFLCTKSSYLQWFKNYLLNRHTDRHTDRQTLLKFYLPHLRMVKCDAQFLNKDNRKDSQINCTVV